MSNLQSKDTGATFGVRNSLSGGLADDIIHSSEGTRNEARSLEDLQMLTPARGRLGIEEIPYQGQDPIPSVVVPPPIGGWSRQVQVEDSLKRFENRSTKGLDGGGRSTNITRYTPQLLNWQQGDDASRFRMFERNNVSQTKTDQKTFV